MKNKRVSTAEEKSAIGNKQISRDRQILFDKNQDFDGRQIFTDKEASDYLKISQITLWRLRKAGKIGFHRAASKIIYTSKNLEEYLKSTERYAFGVKEASSDK